MTFFIWRSTASRPGFEPFQDALEQMGVPSTKANAFARDSARKLSILRRLIPSAAGALTPVWAEGERGKLLLPALLAGAWDEDHEGDQAVLESLLSQQLKNSIRSTGYGAGRKQPEVSHAMSAFILYVLHRNVEKLLR